ncbi:arylamine N-acetyltransferase family protein [Flavobacterium sp. I3-2]|uniref:arylamine N-acetyltransferase family protein n=1 Tax=Flavobacterium sp. I3-2 TaxID=2748319 RepID=UPI0015A9840F|nr:arylamine N-acetyltransferase [Flavobacterium sp. I3-2]
MDLNKYFERIGFTEECKVDFEILKKLNYLHAITIPFENINPLLKLPVKIDINSIVAKLVLKKRGGYCYEQNTLFLHILTEIGFEVRPLAGRVVWNDSINSITSLTHMFLLVTYNQIEYIIDVGFGAQTLTSPLKFVLDEVQETPHETYQIIKFEDDFVLQTRINNNWKSMYRFNKNPQYFVDFEVGNWYTSTNPDFIFTNILFLSKADKNGRYSLVNNIFKTYDLNGTSKTLKIETIEELKNIITSVFNIEISEEEEFLDKKLNTFL